MRQIAITLMATLCLYGCGENRQPRETQPEYEVRAEAHMSELSCEEQTERLFYEFVRDDVAGSDAALSGGVWYYTGFASADEAFGTIINWILPLSERKRFGSTQRYESELLEVRYTECDADGGFASLALSFAGRSDLKRCRVIFRSPQ